MIHHCHSAELHRHSSSMSASPTSLEEREGFGCCGCGCWHLGMTKPVSAFCSCWACCRQSCWAAGCRLVGSTALLERNGKLLCSSAADGTTEIPHKKAVDASKVLSTMFFPHTSKLNSDCMIVLGPCGIQWVRKQAQCKKSL